MRRLRLMKRRAILLLDLMTLAVLASAVILRRWSAKKSEPPSTSSWVAVPPNQTTMRVEILWPKE